MFYYVLMQIHMFTQHKFQLHTLYLYTFDPIIMNMQYDLWGGCVMCAMIKHT